MDIQDLLAELEKIEEIEAIAIGGSRAGLYSDASSDYDIYIYSSSLVPKEKRQNVLKKFCSTIELNNTYWEQEDNCILKNGIPVDLVYRNINDFLLGIHRVVIEHQPSNGYTTCLWHNLLHSKIVFDRNQRLLEGQTKYTMDYPEPLRRNIIQRNMALLSGSLPAYEDQIKKAVSRKDFNSIQHRTTEFLSSYFDVIFALNRKTHPGEKRLLSICQKECQILPLDFEKNIMDLFQSIFHDEERFLTSLEKIICNIKGAVKENL